MSVKSFEITLKCLFCGQALRSEQKENKSGDLIKCSSCGESNDFDSVMDISREEALEISKKEAPKIAKELLEKMLKNLK